MGRLLTGLIVLALGAGGAAAAERQVPASDAQVLLSFAPVVKRVAPAVVNVYASRTVEQRVSPFFNDPFFRQFFGDQFGGRPSPRVQRSLGSGVIVDPSGLVVTNLHVIANADEVKVALADRREFAAELVLKDERWDIAMLRIKGGELPSIEFADSDKVEVGDLTLAIGDPFGVGQTVTSGIVSAFHVPGGGSGGADSQFFIQTDAAINPGNSGGALVDMNGRLIGINRMIVSPSGSSAGIGFAIPSNLVRVVTEAALTGKAPVRPWLGANLQNVTADIAEGLGIDQPRGTLVASVTEGGPAAAGGLASGDLIIAIDGIPVDDLGSLNYRLATKKVGTSAALDFIRRGKTYRATVALAAAPETVPRDELTLGDGSPFSGATVANLSPAVADEIAYNDEPRGAVIIGVASGSPAQRVGFRRGDRVLEVNGVEIATTKTLLSVTAEQTGRWVVRIQRDGKVIERQFRG
jgi:Do/DeqQ family serine protease